MKERQKDYLSTDMIKGKSFFCSWSGGKDSCFAFYHAIKNGAVPKALFTMMIENGERSRSHGLPVEVIQRQARALGVPLVVRKASWNDYEGTFLSALHQFRKDKIEYGVFGDIDINPNLQWVERVCLSADIRPYEPLWKRIRRDILNQFLDSGFRAMVIAVKQGVLNDSFLGRIIDREVIVDMERAGIDASGEKGEYHTVVINGPIFSSAIHLETKEQIIRDGYCFLDVS